MTPSQYKAAAQAISELVLVLVDSYPSLSKWPIAFQERVVELAELREALEAEGLTSNQQ